MLIFQYFIINLKFQHLLNKKKIYISNHHLYFLIKKFEHIAKTLVLILLINFNY